MRRQALITLTAGLLALSNAHARTPAECGFLADKELRATNIYDGKANGSLKVCDTGKAQLNKPYYQVDFFADKRPKMQLGLHFDNTLTGQELHKQFANLAKDFFNAGVLAYPQSLQILNAISGQQPASLSTDDYDISLVNQKSTKFEGAKEVRITLDPKPMVKK